MGTSFKEIYERAIFRFSDYEILKQKVKDREDILEKYLISAKTDFTHACDIDLSCDYTSKEFVEDLGDEIIEILALGISYYWLSYQALNSKALKNVLNSKDYYYYSPANLLKEVQTLRRTVRDEFNGKMRKYSFDHNSVANLRP